MGWCIVISNICVVAGLDGEREGVGGGGSAQRTKYTAASSSKEMYFCTYKSPARKHQVLGDLRPSLPPPSLLPSLDLMSIPVP